MLKCVGVTIIVLASAATAEADGFYVGGFGSTGDTFTTHYSPHSDENSVPYFGVFAGYNFVRGDWEFGPEIRIRSNFDWHTMADFRWSEIRGGSLYSARDGRFAKENFSPSVGLMIGKRYGRIKPYVGASVGIANFEKRIRFAATDGTSVGDYKQRPTTVSVHGGVEYDIGRSFLRLEAEYRKINNEGFRNWEQYHLTAGFGVRF